MSEGNRPLAEHERRLVRWMLEHGKPEAAAFLSQLEIAEITPWKCKCGCASINFRIQGFAEAPPGVHVLADFVFGEGDEVNGIFVFESGGILSGLEVYDLSGVVPATLPDPTELRPFPRS